VTVMRVAHLLLRPALGAGEGLLIKTIPDFEAEGYKMRQTLLNSRRQTRENLTKRSHDFCDRSVPGWTNYHVIPFSPAGRGLARNEIRTKALSIGVWGQASRTWRDRVLAEDRAHCHRICGFPPRSCGFRPPKSPEPGGGSSSSGRVFAAIDHRR
jgi:hypothetical protein